MIKRFIAKIIEKFFIFQEKFLEKKYSRKKINLKSSNSMSKSHITSGVNLTLNSKLEENKKNLEEKIKLLAKENLDNLLEYTEKNGAKVYFVKNAKKLLNPIREKVGFIIPKKGFSAFYLNLFLNKKISFKTKPIFVFEREKLSGYKILYNFYLWAAYDFNMPGFNENFKKNIEELENLDFSTLNYNEIMNLKDAINIEKDALKFSLSFMKELEGAKTAYSALLNKDDGINL